jgi:glycosyltransferase involved in cell wall biosynthesis
MKQGNKEKPLLTVVIPTFNRAEFLEATLDMIVGSVRRFWESWPERKPIVSIIVGDNCSTDHTAKVLERFDYEHFAWYSNITNVGITKNILRGVFEATGDYIWILGDDDVFSEHLIEEILLFIISHNKQVDYILLKYEQFSSEDEIEFDSKANFRKTSLDTMLESRDFLSFDLAFGFISANIYRAEMLGMAIDHFRPLGELENNCYLNKLLAYYIMVRSEKVFALDALQLYQRVTCGSYFSRDIDVRVKVFICDNFEIADRVKDLHSGLYDRLVKTYRKMNLYDIYQVKCLKENSLWDIVRIFRIYRYSYKAFFLIMILAPRPLAVVAIRFYFLIKKIIRYLVGICCPIFNTDARDNIIA